MTNACAWVASDVRAAAFRRREGQASRRAVFEGRGFLEGQDSGVRYREGAHFLCAGDSCTVLERGQRPRTPAPGASLDPLNQNNRNLVSSEIVAMAWLANSRLGGFGLASRFMFLGFANLRKEMHHFRLHTLSLCPSPSQGRHPGACGQQSPAGCHSVKSLWGVACMLPLSLGTTTSVVPALKSEGL